MLHGAFFPPTYFAGCYFGPTTVPIVPTVLSAVTADPLLSATTSDAMLSAVTADPILSATGV